MWSLLAQAGDVARFIAATLPLIIGLLGLGGLVFTALRFRRDDTTAVVTQQSTILGDMKTVNDELRTTARTLREERDQCHEEVSSMRKELQSARESLSGQITELHEKMDNDG